MVPAVSFFYKSRSKRNQLENLKSPKVWAPFPVCDVPNWKFRSGHVFTAPPKIEKIPFVTFYANMGLIRALEWDHKCVPVQKCLKVK